MPARRIHISGVVQGVGFRPAVWRTARDLALGGWVRNSSSGVDIHLEGPEPALASFPDAFRSSLPPLAAIDSWEEAVVEAAGASEFVIVASESEPGASLPVSPDVATCDDCLRELRDPSDRRFRYPFLNCTNCGPRYTIVRDIPYDRPLTTMAGFPLCAACAAEYDDPGDRRFHAQPVACPDCGPRVWLERGSADGAAAAGAGETPSPVARGDEAIARVRADLASGAVVAIKGLGGYHLACDAASEDAVATLRQRKQRDARPFALMTADLDAVRRHVLVDDVARALLEHPARPIVLLPRRPGSPVAASVAPGRHRLGFMLPYTPLHHLLLAPGDDAPETLVMTSANLTDEPIVYRDEDARARLGPLADLLLLHDRPIHVRCDDSVATVAAGGPYLLRRSRGHAPLPIALPFAAPPLLATGGELKNVFCLTRDRHAYLGHHIGEMGHLETLRAFAAGVEHLGRLFRVEPALVVHDLHPDYQTTRWALEHASAANLPTLAVQHHHAHLASCLAEHGRPLDTRAIGVTFDGTGYGPDGVIWGGEFLVGGYAGYERALYLRPCPLPGGDAAARHPWRVALAWLRELDQPWSADLPPVRAADPEAREVLAAQLDQGINTPRTTSMGRLFDAAAALAGLTARVRYEAQAACELEAAADHADHGAYPFAIAGQEVDPRPALASLVADVRSGVPLPVIAARFHDGVTAMVLAACEHLRRETGLDTVALSGGVWQNVLLLERTVASLAGAGFTVLVHRRVPASDGGLALGQAAVAAARHATDRR
jgi:hydrogenase maturation protein HypF